jgi:hypothetical protein
MLMMMGGGMAPPVWGCADGHLILGSSGKTLTKVLETAGGKNPNITKSKRFQSEAIAPGSGKLDSITFTDESRMAEQLQEAVGGIATMMGFAGMAAQQAPPQVRTIITTIPTILGKLVPVVGEIDFFQSSASVSTFNNDKWVTHSVQNYKDPKSLSKEEPDQGISEPDATEE